MNELDTAKRLFERLEDWLESRGIVRGTSSTELEFGRRVETELGSRGVLRFLNTYYLPAVYGGKPRVTAGEAEALVDELCGTAPPVSEASAGTPDTPSGQRSPRARRCRRCRRGLPKGAP